MVQQSALRLEWLCINITPLLKQIPTEEFEEEKAEGKWSKKQILGHLIDSASNNHQRFIRGQFETRALVIYNQDSWNEYGHYKVMSTTLIVDTWAAVNLFLSALIKHIPSSAYSNILDMGNQGMITLEYVIEDYVTHLEHHLRQIVAY